MRLASRPPAQAERRPGRAPPPARAARIAAAVVKGSDAPLSWSGGAQLVTQQITTTPAQAYETLVVTFSGEAYAQATLA